MPAERAARIVLVILNWNKTEDTLECLESARAIRHDSFETVLVDNHSSDDVVARVRSGFPEVRILENPDNFGYAGGNNVGLRDALARGAEWVFLLNNDITLDPEVLTRLEEAARRCPAAGMLAPKVLLYDERTTVNSLGTSMDWLRLRPKLGAFGRPDDPALTEPFEAEILMGCALFLKREMLERVGLLDEDFFIFHEEADWCFRSRRAGFKNLVVPRAVIYHKASKTMREFSALTHYYSYRNFLRLAQKNAGGIRRGQFWAGFVYQIFKHLGWLGSGDPGRKRLARAFFAGITDYFKGRMGRCQRSV